MANITEYFKKYAALYTWIKPYFPYMGIVVFRVTLDILYLIISKIYAYAGLVWSPTSYKIVLSWLIMLAITPTIVRLYRNSSVSSTILLLMNLIYFIPGCTLYSLAALPDIFFVFYVAYWVLLMFWQYIIPYIFFKLPPVLYSRIIFYGLVAAIVLSSIVIAGVYNNFSLHLSLANIYELRATQRDMNLPSIVGYLQPLGAKMIPLAIVWFLYRKKYILVSGLAFVQLLLFSFGGMKSTLFLLVVAILGYYLYREKRVTWFSWGLVALNVMAIVEYLALHSFKILAYLQRRCMMVTNLLSSYYFEYFSLHNPDMLMQSIMRRFGFISEYTVKLPRMIGLEYYNNIQTNANNGLVGDAFCNFGWLGLFLYPLMIILALRFMDACAHGIDRRLLISVFVAYAIAFTNTAFFTTMLTGGFLIISICLYFMPREGITLKDEVHLKKETIL